MGVFAIVFFSAAVIRQMGNKCPSTGRTKANTVRGIKSFSASVAVTRPNSPHSAELDGHIQLLTFHARFPSLIFIATAIIVIQSVLDLSKNIGDRRKILASDINA